MLWEGNLEPGVWVVASLDMVEVGASVLTFLPDTDRGCHRWLSWQVGLDCLNFLLNTEKNPRPFCVPGMKLDLPHHECHRKARSSTENSVLITHV